MNGTSKLDKDFIQHRCIYVIGPQSTGKTTLVNALVQRLEGNVPIIQEIARTVMKSKGFSRNDVDSEDPERRFSLQLAIFEAQIAKERSLLESNRSRIFLSDRSAIDPLIYLMHYSGVDTLRRITSTSEWRDVRDRYADRSRSLIVLLLPVKKFLVDDEIRYMAKSVEDWYALSSAFQSFLVCQGIPFIEIGEECLDIDARVDAIARNSGHSIKEAADRE